MMLKAVSACVVISAACSAVSAAAIRVAIAGDSTAAIINQTTDPGKTGWGMVIGNSFKPDTVVDDRALSGYSSKSFLTYTYTNTLGNTVTNHKWADLLATQPNYILIQFGHNDRRTDPAFATRPDAVTTPYPAYPNLGWQDIDWYRNNLTTFVNDARSINAVPILITPMEELKWSGGQLVRSLQPYSDAVKAVAQALNVDYIDLNTFSANTYSSLGDAGASVYHWTDPDTMVLDRTHFSLAGANLYSDEIVRNLRNIPGIQDALVPVPEPASVATAIAPVAILGLRRRRAAKSSAKR